MLRNKKRKRKKYQRQRMGGREKMKITIHHAKGCIDFWMVPIFGRLIQVEERFLI